MAETLSTTDYSKFKFYKSNRPVRKNPDLENSLLNENKLEYNPIVVDKNYYIVDGQHRFTICKNNNLELYYTVDPEASEKDVIRLNTTSRNWKLEDYLNHYVERNFEEYVFTKSMVEKYPIQLANFVKFVGKGENSLKPFREGNFVIRRDKDNIVEILKQLKRIKEKIQEIVNLKAIASAEWSFLKLIGLRGFDVNEFLKQCENYPDGVKLGLSFVRSDNIVDHLVNKVYNRYKSSKKLRLR